MGLLGGFLPRLVGGDSSLTALLGHSLIERLKLTLLWSLFIAFVGLLAFATNPTDSSFRSYLTELSFRRHLRELHRPSPPTEPESDGHRPNHPTSSNPSPAPSSHPASSRAPTVTDGNAPSASPKTASFAPFRFTNRVSIALRTPPYLLRDYLLFTIVTVSSSSSSAGSSFGPSQRKRDRSSWLDASRDETDTLLAGVWFVGAFGKWWLGGRMVGSGLGDRTDPKKTDEEGGKANGTFGVVDLKALDGSEESVAAVLNHKALDLELPPPYSFSSPGTNHPLHPHHHRSHSPARSASGKRSSRSRRPSIEDPSIGNVDKPPPVPHPPSVLSRTSSSTELAPSQLSFEPPSVPPAPLPSPGGPPSPSPPSTQQQQQPISFSSDPSIPVIDRSLLSANPVLAEIHQALLGSHGVTAELRGQLAQFSTQSQVSFSTLQSTLEELRTRKKEEDADRLEVKTRTKALEDGKRQAEGLKREADKKLRVVEGLKDGVLERIRELEGELVSAREKMTFQREEIRESDERMRTKGVEIQEETRSKREQVKEVEMALALLGGEIRELEAQVKEEEHVLESSKADALHAFEEARRFASTFTSFPQPRSIENERFALATSTTTTPPPFPTGLSSQTHTPQPSPPHTSKVSPSFYDLPIQQLPISLLNRRKQHDNPAPNAFNPNHPSSLAHVSSHSSLDDVFGFEDFGPVAYSSRFNKPGPSSNLALTAPLPATSQAYRASHGGSSDRSALSPLDEDEPGSPSSLSASLSNLLPRGLFQSISTEGLLTPDGEPDEPTFPDRPRLSLDSEDAFGAESHAQRLCLSEAEHFFPINEQPASFTSASASTPTNEQGDHHQHQHQHQPLDDAALPSSPKSVFSDDPRSLLLDPYSDENVPSPGHTQGSSSRDFHFHQEDQEDRRSFASSLAPSKWFTSPSSTPSVSSPTTTTADSSRSSSQSIAPGSSTTPTSTPTADGKLNPDARVFNLNPKSNGLIRPSSDLSVNSAPFVPTVARLSSESLPGNNNNPLLSSPTSNGGYAVSPGGGAGSRFFSSIRAFAPSAAEREALTRALRTNNGSSRSLDTNPELPPSPTVPASARSFYSLQKRNSRARLAVTPFTTATNSAVEESARPAGEDVGWVERPRLATADDGGIRRKSFSRFFSLGSSFSRKQTEDPSSAFVVQPREKNELSDDYWAPNWKKPASYKPTEDVPEPVVDQSG